MATTGTRDTATTLYLRPGEAARLLGVGRTSFWRLRKRDDFPRPRRFAGADRFSRREVIEWAESSPESSAGQRSA